MPGSAGRPSQDSTAESVFGIIAAASVLALPLTRSAHLLITVPSLVMPASCALQNDVASAIESMVSTTGCAGGGVPPPVTFLTVSSTVPPGSEVAPPPAVGVPTKGWPPPVDPVGPEEVDGAVVL